jgi:ATP-dependent helicase HrpA
VPDPRDRPADKQTQADQKHAPLRDEKSDFLSLLKLWRAWRSSARSCRARSCAAGARSNFLSYLRLTEWHDVHGQVMEVVKGELALRLNTQPGQYEPIHRALLAGLISQVAERKEQAEYLGANGTKLHIHPGSGQFKAKPPWIVSAEQVQTTKVYARNVARIDPRWVEEVGEHLVRRQHYEPHWERKAGRAAVYERVTLYGLTLVGGSQRALRACRSQGGTRDVHPARAGAHGIRLARAVLRPQPEAAGGSRVPAAEGPARGLAGRRGQLYAFFEARVPANISTSAAFERWRREAEAKEPRLLWLTEKDIAAGDAQLEADRFPDHLSAGPLVVQLRYRFEPGHEDDGVSALIPLHVLNQVPEEPFAWLAPGFLEEKVTALVRSLPKQLRVNFVPVPDAVAKVMPLLDPGRGSLYAQMADALSRTGGVRVPRDSFREDVLPPHLRMNFLLLDEHDKVIARSRSLSQLRAQHAGASQQEYARQSQITTGARAWEFGDLPEQQQIRQGPRAQVGFPALVDEGATVGVRAFATPAEAEASQERGAARLVQLAMARDMKSLRRDLAVNVQGEMVYRTLEPHPLLHKDLATGRDLRDDLLDRVVMTVFLDGREPLRSAASADARIAAHRAGIGLPLGEISRTVQLALERLARIRIALPKAHPATAADLRAQLSWLVPAGFLLVTPWERLKEYPRYLQAIEQRLEKHGRDPKRDAQLVAQVAPLEARYRERVKMERGARAPERDEYRWLLEELRVSLFAQQLKTRVPVSARRLDDAWAARETAVPRA